MMKIIQKLKICVPSILIPLSNTSSSDFKYSDLCFSTVFF